MSIYSKIKSLMPNAVAGLVLLFSPPKPGWTSVWEGIEQRRLPAAAQSLISSMTGITVPMPQTGLTGGFDADVAGILNPIDFENAPTPKAYMWTRIGLKALTALTDFIIGLAEDLT